MKKKKLTIKVTVEYSDWYPWKALELDARKRVIGSVRIPDRIPGVYIVRKKGSKKWLLIGSSKNIRRIIKECLVHSREYRPYSAGNRIRKHEDISKLEVRWGLTDRPFTVEEELLKKHKKEFRCFPKYYGKIRPE